MRAFACRAWVQRLALAAVASVSFAAAAAAAVIHYETTFGPADMADFDPFGTPIQVQLPKFDTSTYDVSKLIGINVSLSTQGTAAIDVFNNKTTTRTSTSQSVVINVDMAGPLGLTISNALTASNTTAVAVPGGSSVTILGLPIMDSTTASVAPADWAAYEGSGLLYLTLLVTNDGGTYSGTGGSGGLSYGGGAILGGTVAISYELVPEPVGVGLFGMALVGTALARRRTRRG
ncbi:MAG: PEP-CTERM sorting domain-containing protein [Rhodospirillales bacterium]|nr:PEP-CTERM sorting domain-containing protein [Rhodospirillales bacterium]